MAPKTSTWNGTWVGNWEAGRGTQIVFAGEVLICMYWGDDYLPEVRAAVADGGATVTLTWPSGQAVLTRNGERSGHIVIRENGKAEVAFDVIRETG